MAMPADLHRMVETTKYRGCHRVVTLETKEYPHEFRPTDSETLYLTSIIQDTIKNQGMLGDGYTKPRFHQFTHQYAPVSHGFDDTG